MERRQNHSWVQVRLQVHYLKNWVRRGQQAQMSIRGAAQITMGPRVRESLRYQYEWSSELSYRAKIKGRSRLHLVLTCALINLARHKKLVCQLCLLKETG